MSSSPDWNRRLGVRLRPYQAECLEIFRRERENGRDRFHFVAPPGAGKTILGIALMLESGERACVFSPNAAIQTQWADRFRDVTAEVGEDPELRPAAFGVGPEAEAPFLSLTYQSVTTKVQGSDGLHPNARALLDRLREEGHRVLVFDECHHLTGYWGEVLGAFVEEVEGAVVLGLTATPPLDRSARERGTYLEVVGEIVHQIPLPSVVKEGNLAPYQDLVLFTRPEEGELEVLYQTEEELKELVDELEQLNAPLLTPALFVERALERCERGGDIVPMDEWMRDAPDQVIAYVRYLVDRGLDVPASVLWLDEMDDVFQVEDLVRVLQDHLTGHLLPAAGEKHPLVKRIPKVLKRLGFRLVNKQFQAASVGAARQLGFSRSKLQALREILIAEANHMMDDLRALVLTDFELGRRDHPDDFTALDVIHLLTGDPDLDELDPILLTGRSVLVDDDLTPRFLEEARAFLQARGLAAELEAHPEKGCYRIEGSGRDWGTTTYVSLITELLDRGVTRCLVGTRALLGEGWDSLTLNTLVDLTVVSSYVSVNQIRGRTIRKDPQDPAKCANNWDVVTVLPGVGYGLSDLVRLERKHGQFYGVSDDGVIEKGLGHVHPWLSKGSHASLLARLDELNAAMLARARDRPGALERWGIGTPYEGVDAACVELAFPEVRERGPAESRLETTLPAVRHVEEVQLVVRRGEEVRASMLSYWWLLLPPLLALADHLYRRWAVSRLLEEPPPEPELERDVESFAAAVLEAMVGCELLPADLDEDCLEVHPREGGYFRIVLAGAGAEDTERFSEAVFELLGPVQNHKYLVERRVHDVSPSELTWALVSGEPLATRRVGVHPVPSLLGRNRERAERFHRAWSERVSPGELFYTRKGEGKLLAKQWFRKRQLEMRRERKLYFT